MKTLIRKAIVCGTVVAVGLLVAAPAVAGAWNNDSGTGDSGDFTWTNGGDLNGLFTDVSGDGPVSMLDNSLFFNLDFAVSTTGPLSQTDTMTVDVHAATGLQFSFVRFAFAGAMFAFPSTFVDAQASLVLTDLDNAIVYDLPPEIGPFSTNPTPFPFDNVDQTWSGLIVGDLENVALPPTNVRIDLTHLLSVTGFNGNINSQQGTLELELGLIPEPGTLALMAVGGLALLRRRR